MKPRFKKLAELTGLPQLWRALVHYHSPAEDPVLAGLLAAVIGLIVGYATLLFRQGIWAVQEFAFGSGAEDIIVHLTTLPWWQVVFAPVLGGAVVALMLRLAMAGGAPLGVADVIEANALKTGRIPLRQGIASAAIAVTAIGSGSSVGREGPIVHFGATLASGIARLFRAPPPFARMVLGCGVAAGVAASFNAPIAGVFFAHEVILGSYALSAFAPIVIASVIGTIVTRIHIGDFPAFTIPDYALGSFWEMPAFALLGLLSAGVAIAFIRLVDFFDTQLARLPVPRWTLPPLAGLVLGLAALGLPELIGVGYGATDAALKEAYPLYLLIALLAAKMIVTPLCIAARFGGGVFSPSLFLGAMTGGAFGLIAAMIVPAMAASHGFYAIVGMGAVSGAVLGAPISTFLIVFELTGDYQITLALMISTAIASVLAKRLSYPGFFAWQLDRRGLSPDDSRARLALRRRKVAEVMTEDYVAVSTDSPLSRVRALLEALPGGALIVVDENRTLIGAISLTDITAEFYDTSLDRLVVAGDIARPLRSLALAEDSLDTVLGLMEASGEDWLPVVDDINARRVRGVIARGDVLATFNRLLLDVERELSGR